MAEMRKGLWINWSVEGSGRRSMTIADGVDEVKNGGSVAKPVRMDSKAGKSMQMETMVKCNVIGKTSCTNDIHLLDDEQIQNITMCR